MNWREPVFDYCERQGPGFWAEPANAVSNAAFLVAAVAAVALLRRSKEKDLPALALAGVTALVGLGSFAFHTLATQGAMLADVIPIALFIYGYFCLGLHSFFGLSTPRAVAATAAFGAASLWIESNVHGLNGSIAYLPAFAALTGFAAALAWGEGREERRRVAAAGLAGASAVFALSLAFRTMDRAICGAFPGGTHFLWHLLNAAVLYLALRAAILWRRTD